MKAEHFNIFIKFQQFTFVCVSLILRHQDNKYTLLKVIKTDLQSPVVQQTLVHVISERNKTYSWIYNIPELKSGSMINAQSLIYFPIHLEQCLATMRSCQCMVKRLSCTYTLPLVERLTFKVHNLPVAVPSSMTF